MKEDKETQETVTIKLMGFGVEPIGDDDESWYRDFEVTLSPGVPYEGTLYITDMEKTVIGHAKRPDGTICSVHDTGLVFKEYEGMGMTEEEAVEFFDFNTIGAWMGPNTPLFTPYPWDLDEGQQDDIP